MDKLADFMMRGQAAQEAVNKEIAKAKVPLTESPPTMTRLEYVIRNKIMEHVDGATAVNICSRQTAVDALELLIPCIQERIDFMREEIASLGTK